LAFFVCEHLDNGEAYLRVDYSTRCYTDQWMLHLIYAGAMVLVFPIGIPLMYYVFLWVRRDVIDPIVPSTGKRGRMTEDKENTLAAIALREQDATLVRLSFLFDSYEPEYWWWEIVVCFNRVIQTNVDVLLVDAPKLQLILILAVVLVNLDLTSNFAPYIEDTDDVFATIAQWCTVALLLFSIGLENGAIKPDDSGSGLVFVLLLFTVIIVYIGYAIAYAWEDIRDIPKHMLSAKPQRNKREGTVSRSIAEAGEDLSPENGEYFPKETNCSEFDIAAMCSEW